MARRQTRRTTATTAARSGDRKAAPAAPTTAAPTTAEAADAADAKAADAAAVAAEASAAVAADADGTADTGPAPTAAPDTRTESIDLVYENREMAGKERKGNLRFSRLDMRTSIYLGKTVLSKPAQDGPNGGAMRYGTDHGGPRITARLILTYPADLLPADTSIFATPGEYALGAPAKATTEADVEKLEKAAEAAVRAAERAAVRAREAAARIRRNATTAAPDAETDTAAVAAAS